MLEPKSFDNAGAEHDRSNLSVYRLGLMGKRLLYLCGAICLSAMPLVSQQLQQERGDWEEINFATNRSVLTDGFPSLLRLAELLEQHPGYRVKLEGFADSIGAAGYNMNLGRRRAEAVRDFLVKYGARTGQIEIGSGGEQRPAADNARRTGRWINRRVEITVTDGGGRVVSDQGVQAAIESIGTGANAQEGCCERILEEMKKLDQILAALADLKGQYQELKDEHQSLKDDFDKLKQAQQALGTEVGAAPEPVTEGRVRQMIGEEAPKPSDKYARYNLMAGPASPGGNLAVGAEGQVFLPFAGRHAVQAQGDFRHSFGRNEGQFDLGIVNRFGPVQAGVFSSFKYVKFQEFSHGGSLGQAAGTLDYLFSQGRVGLFGTKGFLDGAVLNSRFLGRNRVEETYLSIVDQLGVSTAIGAWGDSWFEGDFGTRFRRFDSNAVGGSIRYVHPITDRIALTLGGGLNETLITGSNSGSFTIGLEFGKWLNPKDYARTEGPVPVNVPKVRYEVHTRTVRTGNDQPVADAGPDQVGVESGVIMLDGSASFDPDDDPITFAWEQVSGPVVALASVTSSQTSFTAEEGQTFHFRLTVKDDHGGVGTDGVMVSTADSRITIRSFTADPLHIRIGENATLAWDVLNATEVEISGIGPVDPKGGSLTVSPTETTTYTLTARNPKREVNQTVELRVDSEITILRFAADPLHIPIGETATLTWDVLNATEAEISGIGPVDPKGGSLTVSPTETTTYTLTARNPKREVNQTVEVTVDSAISILRFAAEPNHILIGGKATLTWDVLNATEVEISGIGPVDPKGGSLTVNPTETTTYTLTARNPEREVNRTVEVTVDSAISILRFAAEPNHILIGGKATLTWDVLNATEVEISGIGPVDPKGGSLTVNPTETTTYTLTARNPEREVTQTVEVTVDSEITIRRFTAKPGQIIEGLGTEVTLEWDVLNATEVEISGIGSVDPRGGSLTVSQTETTTYTLTARNPMREVKQTVEVPIVDAF